MANYAILVGNDINNVTPGKSWGDLVTELKNHFDVKTVNDGNKPFPMLYEEIFLNAVRKNGVDEKEVKAYIADRVSHIPQNEIHQRIRELPIAHVMTTNYEFTLAGCIPETNTGVVKETTFSIFRRYEVGNKTFWHIHGDCKHPNSINLGYEHYCGQLQAMRNYVVSGTTYTSKQVIKTQLIRRLIQRKKINNQSWLDLFFTKDIYIFGLSLDFVESDLWWLLTYRARIKLSSGAKSLKVYNKIHYFVPQKYIAKSTDKLELLRANDVVVHSIASESDRDYYREVVDRLEKL